jgi:hypothetical protein
MQELEDGAATWWARGSIIINLDIQAMIDGS